MFIPDRDPDFFPIPDPGLKKRRIPDLDPQHWLCTVVLRLYKEETVPTVLFVQAASFSPEFRINIFFRIRILQSESVEKRESKCRSLTELAKVFQYCRYQCFLGVLGLVIVFFYPEKKENPYFL
jgi:hypothetical protein